MPARSDESCNEFTALNLQVSPAAALRAIRNPRIRNLVRGVLTGKSDTAHRAMDRLRRECGPADAAAAFSVLQARPRGGALPLAPDFPNVGAEIDQVPFYNPAPLRIELIEQGLRLAREADRLVEAIRLVGRLNASMLNRDHEVTARHFASFRHEFGISFLVAQKAISARHSGVSGDERRTVHSEVIAPFLSPRRQIIAVAFEDSIDEERDYTRIRRTFLRFAASSQLDGDDAAIISDMFGPIATDDTVLAQRVQAYGRWGVLDCVACLFRSRRTLEILGDMERVAAIDDVIPSAVADAWRETFGQLEVERLQSFVGMNDQFYDRTLFSHLPAWSEYQELLDYRVRLERAVGARLNGQFPIAERSANLMAEPKSRLEDLLICGPQAVSINAVDPASCGAFHRTIALIASLDAGRLEGIHGEHLSMLLDQTLDVASMLSRDELAQLMPRISDDRLQEFLRAAILNDLEESRVSNHALRRSLQRLVQSRFDGQIVSLLEHVDSDRHHVSKHLYNLCTEAFLTELYDLFEEPDQVTEAHARILEWWGSRVDDEDARLRAKSHRLTLRLRKIRGAIEETRIYVDPLRFSAWIGDEMSGELRTLALQADAILDDPDRSLNLKDRVRVAIQPRMKLLEFLDRCYAEFCNNKFYGVTSFIGRRIRHGTLHGHLVLELKPAIEAAIEEFRQSAPRFSDFLSRWFGRFDTAVQVMAAERIHVHSKEKARGLIVDTLDEADKANVANRMVESVARSLLDRPQIALTASLIHEFCWLLLETDLKRTRNAVEALRREFVINVDDCRTDRSDLDRRISERIRTLNSAVQQRFEMVRSWFTRPSNQSPSASVVLLFQVVLDEVQQRFPSFRPSQRITGADIDLIGHRFHFFYDALFILVGNAAKHGRGDGILGIDIGSLLTDEKYIHLSVSIRSDLVVSTREAHIARIEEAMTAEVGDAMMRNQNSGIRKLREMVEHVDEIVDFRRAYDANAVIFTIDMRYARS